ncbi:lipopolysaccharide transport periplasmic protein LptA [Rhodovulum viride]|uniref:Lipopolysaccharide transport periplasmic protein LptA n=1 Tax=Rhodovulum viride TaxID=1231134 RepID=A0ABX9DCL1_9RHOB|nr:LptA/OstA family protein [Rhodovulum viride]RAP40059.1 lipopolysaccharide transport periplasmic protein LptA [Rhodovulum viride]
MSPSNRGKGPVVSIRGRLLAFALVLAVPAAAWAQGAQIAFGSLDHDASLPVEVTAESLSVDQGDGTAVFSGDVVVGQGTLRLSAARVLVVYGSGGASSGKISRLEASGSVVLVLGEDAAQAQGAVYSIDTATIVMTGDVLLTQGDNAVEGQRLTVDLNRGTGAMEGRVRTVLTPASDKP